MNTAYSLTWVTEHLAVGQAPMSYSQLDSLKNQGITAILNLCAEFCDLHDIEREAGFEVYYMPVPDEEAPELVELEKALAWLDEAIYLGKKVLIHCRHGIGRTGTVLNAYLLRRGLGHKLADKTLKNLRSKPANFDQWWTIRKYGRKSGKLSVREPSLEFKQLVDLGPFLADYASLVLVAEDLSDFNGNGQRCGRDHSSCCHTPVSLTLLEAIALAKAINVSLTAQERESAIDRAVEVAQQERATAADADRGADFCLSGAGQLCPLSVNGSCMVFKHRPLQCRLHGVDEATVEAIWHEVLAPTLTDGSAGLYLAYTGGLVSGKLPRFSLPDVVSGRFVQGFFHLLLSNQKNGHA